MKSPITNKTQVIARLDRDSASKIPVEALRSELKNDPNVDAGDDSLEEDDDEGPRLTLKNVSVTIDDEQLACRSVEIIEKTVSVVASESSESTEALVDYFIGRLPSSVREKLSFRKRHKSVVSAQVDFNLFDLLSEDAIETLSNVRDSFDTTYENRDFHFRRVDFTVIPELNPKTIGDFLRGRIDSTPFHLSISFGSVADYLEGKVSMSSDLPDEKAFGVLRRLEEVATSRRKDES